MTDVAFKDTVADFNITVEQPVKQHFICSLESQHIAVLLAPSGAGKTSLFNAIAGLSPCRGSIQVAAEPQERLPTYQRHIAYVTQSALPFSGITVAKLIKLVTQQQATPFDVSWAIEPLGLSDKLTTPCQQLSGGQKQRVALLLAMLKGAPLLLLDEVLCGLDQTSKRHCIAVIRHYLKLANAAALVACHQFEDILALADSTLLQLKQGDNKVWQAYPVESGLRHYQQDGLLTEQQQAVKAVRSASEFVSTFSATVIAHHYELGLSEYQVGQQRCFTRLNAHHTELQTVSLMLRANRVGIAKNALCQSSFVNQLKVQIEHVKEVSWQGEKGTLISVRLLTHAGAHLINVWITQLSYIQLQPQLSQTWYLIGKADAMHCSGRYEIVSD